MKGVTFCLDKETGGTLAIYPEVLKLVEVGEDFYIGQKPFTVEKRDEIGVDLILTLSPKQESEA